MFVVCYWWISYEWQVDPALTAVNTSLEKRRDVAASMREVILIEDYESTWINYYIRLSWKQISENDWL